MADREPAASVAPYADTAGVVVAGCAWNDAAHAWPEERAAVAGPLGSDAPDESATDAAPPARGLASDGAAAAIVAVVVDVAAAGGAAVPAAGSLVAGAPRRAATAAA